MYYMEYIYLSGVSVCRCYGRICVGVGVRVSVFVVLGRSLILAYYPYHLDIAITTAQ